MHGGVDEKLIKQPNLQGIISGLKNLQRHLAILQSFGQSVVVGFNRFAFDTDEEIDYTRTWCQQHGADFALNDGFVKGGDGAIELAQKVLEIIKQTAPYQ